MSVDAEYSATLLHRYSSSLTQVYAPPQRVLQRGEGALVWDTDNRQYLDLLAGIAVNALGHSHPAIVKAVTEQFNPLGPISNIFTSEAQIRAAEQLLRISAAPQGSRVFFANSGTEANEAALKLARLHGKTQRHRVIALRGGFHGRTMGALSLTYKPSFREPFEPLPAGVEWVEPNDIAALEAAVDHSCAAVLLEPVQGEAGVHGLSAEYLAAARRITEDQGALLILDEVQTGIGRTGDWLASSALAQQGILPDAITLAKGLGSGFPIGALITFGEQVSGLFGRGHHGSTFGGNPPAAAAALATLETIQKEHLLHHVRQVSQLLRAGLQKLEFVTEVRAYGLLVGVDITGVSATALVQAALEAGFIINATGEQTLRLAPALIITEEQIMSFLTALPGIYAQARELRYTQHPAQSHNTAQTQTAAPLSAQGTTSGRITD